MHVGASLPSSCPGTGINDIVVLKTIHIQTSIAQNGTFVVDNSLTVSVENAPTNLDLTTTYISQSATSTESIR